MGHMSQCNSGAKSKLVQFTLYNHDILDNVVQKVLRSRDSTKSITRGYKDF